MENIPLTTKDDAENLCFFKVSCFLETEGISFSFTVYSPQYLIDHWIFFICLPPKGWSQIY